MEDKAKQRARDLGYGTDPLNRAEYTANEVREAFIEGYQQAEKDLELTWEDIREIYCTTLNLREHLGASVFGEPLYQEVLNRIKERKEK